VQRHRTGDHVAGWLWRSCSGSLRLGMAWAFVRYSRDYVQIEEPARAVGLGVHAHACQPAWEWRVGHRKVGAP
jgi:hypothetical protein